jgi:hypothetical protein
LVLDSILRQAPPARNEPAGHLGPDGEIVWVSGPLPGAVHDLTAARTRGIVGELAAGGLLAFADQRYTGTGDKVRVQYKGKNKPPHPRTPTAPMPGYAAPVNAPTPSSSAGASGELGLVGGVVRAIYGVLDADP